MALDIFNGGWGSSGGSGANSYVRNAGGGSEFWSNRSGGGASTGGLDRSGVVPYGNLAASTNRFMTDQARQPYEINLPGYSAMVGKRSENIQSELSGQVPGDVLNSIIQAGAERGILTGSPGGPNANAAWLRALGLTSLGLQQQGSQDLSRSIADTPVSPLMNPASLYVPEAADNRSLAAARAGMGAGRSAAGGYGGAGSVLPSSVDLSGAAAPPIRYTPPSWQSGNNNGTVVGYGPGGGPGDIQLGNTIGNGANYSYSNAPMGDWYSNQNSDQYSSSSWQDNQGTPAGLGSWDSYIANQGMSYDQPQFSSQNYWDSAAGLQDPNRPADEASFVDYADSGSWY